MKKLLVSLAAILAALVALSCSNDEETDNWTSEGCKEISEQSNSINIASTDININLLKDALIKQLYKTNPGYVNTLFTKDKPIEMLSIPDDWNIENVKSVFPGTVGVVFKPDIANEVEKFEAENIGVKVQPEDIKFVAKSSYHTNSGKSVVNRDSIEIRCDDPIFKLDRMKNCMENVESITTNTGIYLAWDLKDYNGNSVSPGTYYHSYEFYWRIEVARLNVTSINDLTEQCDKNEIK